MVKEDHAFLHALLKKFGEKTGFEMLVNTSFNLNGEPIVADEWDALDVFLRTDIDLLVINHSMIVKSKIPLELIHLYRSHIKTIKNDRIKSVYELI